MPPGTHWIGGCVGPRAGLDSVERKKSCAAGNRTRAFQPVAIPTEVSRLLVLKINNDDIQIRMSVFGGFVSCGNSAQGRASIPTAVFGYYL
jgi:hypothetical protein